MKRIIKILTLLLLFLSCNKEVKLTDEQKNNFIKFYGGVSDDNGIDILQKENGEYLVLGTYETNNEKKNKEIILLRLDEYGNIIGEPITFGSKYDDMGVKMVPNSKGELYIAGNITDTTISGTKQTDVLILKTDLKGKSISSIQYKTQDNDGAVDMILDNDNNIVIAGYNKNNESENIIFLMADDDNDSLKIIYTKGDHGGFKLKGIALNDYELGYLIFSNIYSNPENLSEQEISVISVQQYLNYFDLFTVSYDNSNLYVNDAVFNNNFLYITGIQEDRTSLLKNMFLAIYNFDNSVSRYGSFEPLSFISYNEGDEYDPNCIIDSGEDLVIAGKVKEKDRSDYDFFIRKIDKNGNKIFEEKGGDEATDDEIIKIIKTKDSGYAFVGKSTVDNNTRIAVIKTMSDGVIEKD